MAARKKAATPSAALAPRQDPPPRWTEYEQTGNRFCNVLKPRYDASWHLMTVHGECRHCGRERPARRAVTPTSPSDTHVTPPEAA